MPNWMRWRGNWEEAGVTSAGHPHEVGPRAWQRPWEENNQVDGDDERQAQRRRSLLCHKAVNNVLGQIGVLVDLQRQSAWLQQRRCCNVATEGRRSEVVVFFCLSLTGFTSKANSTCCRSGDTWYLDARDLSWMGVNTKQRSWQWTMHMAEQCATARQHSQTAGWAQWRLCDECPRWLWQRRRPLCDTATHCLQAKQREIHDKAAVAVKKKQKTFYSLILLIFKLFISTTNTRTSKFHKLMSAFTRESI